jgi:catechol 2,3-dioxygenase-like lactoylglutathione lyase family enzyme
MELLLAGVAVADFPRAAEWYGRLFGRGPDVVAHDREFLWRVAETGWLYVVEDTARAGTGLVAIQVPDLDATVADLGARGIGSGPIERESDAARKAVVTDPEGNTIAFIDVSAA